MFSVSKSRLTGNALGYSVERTEDGRAYWAKPLDSQRNRSEQVQVFEWLQRLDCPLLPAPVAWGNGLIEDQPERAVVIYPLIKGLPFDEAWAKAGDDQREGWIARLLRALDILHMHGRVHGDLKPSNILIDESSEVRLIDLDWSFAAHESAGRRTGSIDYMPPEVLEGSPPDGRSDLYSLALVLAGLGGCPLPDVPARLGGDIQLQVLLESNSWQAWLEHCLRHDPLDRPASVAWAFNEFPWSGPQVLMDEFQVRHRYRPAPRPGESALDCILRLSGIHPAPGGFVERVLRPLSDADCEVRWNQLLSHRQLATQLQQGRELTEAMLESLDASVQAAVMEQQDSPDSLRGRLGALFDAAQYDEVIALAVSQTGETLSGSDRAFLLNLSGMARMMLDRPEEALVDFARARQEYQTADDRSGEAKVLNNMAMTYQRQGSLRLATERYQDGLSLARKSGHSGSIADFLFNLAVVAQQEHRVGEALGYFEEAQQRYEALQASDRLAGCATNRAFLLGYCGRFGAALAMLQQASAELAATGWQGHLLAWLRIELLLDSGQHETAATQVQAMSAESRQLPPPHEWMPPLLHYRAAVEGLISFEPGHSASEAATWVGTVTDPAARGEFLLWTAAWHYRRGELDTARSWLARMEPDGLASDSLARLSALILQLQCHPASAFPEVSAQTAGQIESFLADWSRWVPRESQRDLWSHPLYRRARTALQQARTTGASGGRETAGAAVPPFVRTMARLLAAPDSGWLTQWALEALVEAGDAERGFVILLEPEGERIAAATNFMKESVKWPQFEISRSLLRKAIDTGQAIVTTNAQEEGGMGRSVFDLQLVSVLILPLIHEGEVLGAAYLDHRFRQGAFADVQLDLLRVLAGQIASALKQRRLVEQLEAKAVALETANLRLAEDVRAKGREARRYERRWREAQRERADADFFEGIIGTSEPMRRLRDLVGRVSETRLPVIVQGESGTGKELLARAVHAASDRAQGPFIAINCGAFPETLIEAELFGHVRGAFTGADSDREGVFVQADGGTLLLDEINSLPLPQQVKLLRAIEEGEVRPLGSTQAVRFDVRLVAASNTQLEGAVARRQFREDLFYRLNGLTLQMPALRERREDIPLLIDHFRKAWERENARPASFPATWLPGWIRHDWPGNVRQLAHYCHRAFLLGENPLEQEAATIAPAPLDRQRFLESYAPMDGRPNGIQEAVEAFEKDVLQSALARANGKKVEAARLLGLRKQYFYRYEQKHKK